MEPRYSPRETPRLRSFARSCGTGASVRGAQAFDFGFGEVAPFAFGQLAEFERADGGAMDRFHAIAHGRGHALHLMVATFRDDDVGFALAEARDARGRGERVIVA